MEKEKEETGEGGDRDRNDIKDTKKEGEKEEKGGVKQRGGGGMMSSQCWVRIQISPRLAIGPWQVALSLWTSVSSSG